MKRTVAGNLVVMGICSCASVLSEAASGQTIVSSTVHQSTAKPTQDAALNKCDVLAGEPFDQQGVAKPGVDSAYLSGKAAHKACVSAITRHPNVARFIYQLGRAELAMGNAATALQLFNKAAARKHYRAHYALGILYAFGGGVAVNPVKAVKFFRVGANFGDPYALNSLGKRLFRGIGVKQNRKRGLTLLLQAAELGHTYAMNTLGTIFYTGEGVKKNLARALDLYRVAADRKDIYGYNNMGVLYLDGLVVRKDYTAAMKWFIRAHEAGHPYAATNLGRMYFNGWGVAKNISMAATWYEQSARRGDAWGAYNLAWIASKGPRRLRNLATAARYFALAVALERGKPSRLARAKLKRIPVAAKRAAILGSRVTKTFDIDLPAPGRGYGTRMEGTLLALARWQWQREKARIDLLGSSKR